MPFSAIASLKKQTKTSPGTKAHSESCKWIRCGNCVKRVSADIHPRRPAVRGSLTVEAAVTLPVFLIMMCCLLYPLLMLCDYMYIQQALENTSRKLARYAYAEQMLGQAAATDSRFMEWVGESAVYVLSLAGAKNAVLKEAGRERLDHSCIVNGASGLSFYSSRLPDEDNNIDLVVTYEAAFPTPSLPLVRVPMMQRSYRHAWVGDERPGEESAAKEMVYITETGTVYHTFADCTHLNLSVRQAAYAGIERERNQYGARYHPCELCVKAGKIPDTVYITGEGTRFHISLACSGIKRGVTAIPLSQVGDRPLCSRCSKRGGKQK